MPHTDGPLYHPYVTVISLGSPVLFKIYKDMTEYSLDADTANVIVENGSLLIFSQSFYHDHLHTILDNLVETIRVDYQVVQIDTSLNASEDQEPNPLNFKIKLASSTVNNLELSSVYQSYLLKLESNEFKDTNDFKNTLLYLESLTDTFKFKSNFSNINQCSIYVSWTRNKRISITIRHVPPAP